MLLRPRVEIADARRHGHLDPIPGETTAGRPRGAWRGGRVDDRPVVVVEITNPRMRLDVPGRPPGPRRLTIGVRLAERHADQSPRPGIASCPGPTRYPRAVVRSMLAAVGSASVAVRSQRSGGDQAEQEDQEANWTGASVAGSRIRARTI